MMTLSFVGLGTTEVIMLTVFLLLTLVPLFFLIHCVRNKNLTSDKRIVWALIILFIPVFGWIAYLLLGRKPDRQLNETIVNN